MTASCGILFLMVGILGFGADQPNPETLLKRGQDVSELRVAGVPAFRLSARMTDLRTKNVIAKYVLLWSSPEQWREEVSTGSRREVLIGRSNEVLQNPNIDDRSYAALAYFRSSIWPAAVAQLRPDERVRETREKSHDGKRVQCVKLKRPDGERELCFHGSQDVLVKEEWQYERPMHSVMGQRPNVASVLSNATIKTSGSTEFTDVHEFAGRLIPRRIRLRSFPSDDREIQIVELVNDTKVAAAAFAVTEEQEVRPWCLYLRNAFTAVGFSTTLTSDFTKGSTIHAYVDRNGAVRRVRVVDGNEADVRKASQLLKNIKVDPARCGDQTVEGDLFLRFSH